MDINAWLGTTDDLSALPTTTEQQRAALAWRRINDKKTSVVFRPPVGADLAAQTVRLEWDSSATMAESEAGVAPVRKLVIFGVRNHALKTTTVPDTVIQEGYRFNLNNDAFRVVDVLLTLGEVQATAEQTG